MTGAEASKEGGRKDFRRHRLLDRGQYRPASLAGVLDEPCEIRQSWALDERGGGQVEKPGPDDAPAPPQLGDIGDVQVELELLRKLPGFCVEEDVQPLRVRLHQAILDAVVDHLDEMAAAALSAMKVAILDRPGRSLPSGRARDLAPAGGERPEDRIQAPDNLLLPSDHHAVTALQPPDPSAGSNVHVVDPFFQDRLCPPHVILVVGVASVDDRVAGLEPAGEVIHDLFCRVSRGHHDPGHAWLSELYGEIIEREGAGCPLACELADVVGVPGEGDALVAAPQQPADHVSAHATQTDHSDLHGRPPSVVNRRLLEELSEECSWLPR